MNFVKQHFYQLLIAICVAIICLFVGLSIVLLYTPVFKSKYTYTSDENVTHQITFYDNTYTAQNISDDIFSSHTSYGFYAYFKKAPSANINFDTILLSSQFNTSSGSTTQHTTYKRNSVFSLTFYNGNALTEQTYICVQAIIMQIVYFLLIVLFVVLSVIFYRKSKN